jgi:Mannosylglycerate hydrolase MGH1-like glycoside hydrolase domain
VKTRREIIKFLSALSASRVFDGSPSSPARVSAPRGVVQNERYAGPSFYTDAAELQERYDAALVGLRKNIARAYRFAQPVLIEGDRYRGIWLEDGPHEGLIYAPFDPALAANNHRVFFHLQRADGYLPYCVRFDRTESSQIQMAVPIAAPALELSYRLRQEEFLVRAYDACAAWDQWLVRYRITRGTGLCEVFCGYDTGQDNSPRFKGLPWKCPNDDARLCPRIPGMPRLAPDLSATVYGGRTPLAKMAQQLGREPEAAHWLEKAEAIRAAIMKHCFDPDSLCFYDRDTQNRFVEVRGVALLRVRGEHVVDAKLFEEIYRRHIQNPKEFWTPFPFPSIAADDPLFDRSLPLNSWGGATQALTAMRAPRWMENYGKPADLAHVMAQWVQALVRSRKKEDLHAPSRKDTSRPVSCILPMRPIVSGARSISIPRSRKSWATKKRIACCATAIAATASPTWFRKTSNDRLAQANRA